MKIFDSNVHLSKLTGTNKDYLEAKLPHISELLVSDLQDLVNSVDLITISHNEKELDNVKIDPEKIIVDLVKINQLESFVNYKGIAW